MEDWEVESFECLSSIWPIGRCIYVGSLSIFVLLVKRIRWLGVFEFLALGCWRLLLCGNYQLGYKGRYNGFLGIFVKSSCIGLLFVVGCIILLPSSWKMSSDQIAKGGIRVGIVLEVKFYRSLI